MIRIRTCSCAQRRRNARSAGTSGACLRSSRRVTAHAYRGPGPTTWYGWSAINRLLPRACRGRREPRRAWRLPRGIRLQAHARAQRRFLDELHDNRRRGTVSLAEYAGRPRPPIPVRGPVEAVAWSRWSTCNATRHSRARRPVARDVARSGSGVARRGRLARHRGSRLSDRRTWRGRGTGTPGWSGTPRRSRRTGRAAPTGTWRSAAQ